MTSTQNNSGGAAGPPLTDDEQSALARISSDPAFYPASVAAPVAHTLYQMVREHRPRVCVEIECHLGFSTIYLAKALQENGEGELMVFDLHTG